MGDDKEIRKYDVTIDGLTAIRCQVGLRVESGSLNLLNSNFYGVKTAVKVVSGASVKAESVTHSEFCWDAGVVPLDILRATANGNV